MKQPRNALALLIFAALCVLVGGALEWHGVKTPDWISELPKFALFGGAAVMTPGLTTAKELLGKRASTLAPDATAEVPPTEGLGPQDIEP